MELNQYIRTIINNKIRPIFIKSECEICENKNDLHLHHVKLFSEIIKETLERLNLTYRDTNEYTNNELQNIIDIVLGVHLQINYMTLCNSCHKSIHEYEWKQITANNKHEEYYALLKQEKLIQRNIYIDNVVNPYLKNLIGKILLKADQRELINTINEMDDRGRQIKSYKKLNECFIKYNLPFVIIAKRTSKRINNKIKSIRYWEVNYK